MRLPIIVGMDVLRSVCLALLVLTMTSAQAGKTQSVPARGDAGEIATGGHLSVGHRIRDVLNHPTFAGHGRLILPWDDRTYDEDLRLSNIGSLLPYHSHVSPDVVVGALNHMIDDANSGKALFFDFYTEAQKRAEPSKAHTGLFFFRGKVGAPFAIVAPGGGFSYVGSVHEGFPYALEISKKGYNAFVPEIPGGSWRRCCHPGYGCGHLLHLQKCQHAWRQSQGLFGVG
jgi:hypothetical protein